MVVISWLLLCPLSTATLAQDSRAENAVAKQDRPKKGFLYGAVFQAQSQVYRDVENQLFLFPLLGYQGEKLKVFGPFISYALKDAENLELLLLAKPRFAGYEASDSDFFLGMRTRKASIDMGLGVNYRTNNQWKLKTSLSQDVLGRSNGKELSLQMGKQFNFGPVFVQPHIGLDYLDSDFINYYYGVESFEANSARPEYVGESALNTKLGVSVSTPIFAGGFTRLVIENTWYDDAITNSPLTSTETQLRMMLIFSKFF